MVTGPQESAGAGLSAVGVHTQHPRLAGTGPCTLREGAGGGWVHPRFYDRAGGGGALSQGRPGELAPEGTRALPQGADTVLTRRS